MSFILLLAIERNTHRTHKRPEITPHIEGDVDNGCPLLPGRSYVSPDDFQVDLPLLLATHTPHWVPLLHRLGLLCGKVREITVQVVLWQGIFINN